MKGKERGGHQWFIEFKNFPLKDINIEKQIEEHIKNGEEHLATKWELMKEIAYLKKDELDLDTSGITTYSRAGNPIPGKKFGATPRR